MDAVTLNQLIKAAWDEWHSDIDEDCRPSVPNKSFEMGFRLAMKLSDKLAQEKASGDFGGQTG